MKFPSDGIKDWYININKLIINLGVELRGEEFGSEFCECELEKIVQSYPKKEQADLVNGFFWSVWIDQVMYYVVLDGGVRPYLRHSFVSKNRELYFNFRELYSFPKIHNHSGGGQITPQMLLNSNMNYEKPNAVLLLNGKKTFWGEVKNWLKSIKRDDIINQMILAFREDVKIRFDDKYEFLVERL